MVAERSTLTCSSSAPPSTSSNQVPATSHVSSSPIEGSNGAASMQTPRAMARPSQTASRPWNHSSTTPSAGRLVPGDRCASHQKFRRVCFNLGNDSHDSGLRNRFEYKLMDGWPVGIFTRTRDRQYRRSRVLVKRSPSCHGCEGIQERQYRRSANLAQRSSRFTDGPRFPRGPAPALPTVPDSRAAQTAPPPHGKQPNPTAGGSVGHPPLPARYNV